MMQNEKILLDIKNISKVFSSKNTNDVKACSNISLNLYQNEFLAIVGESGSGKTTLLKIICNLEEKTEGEIIYEGQDISKLRGEALRLHRKNIQLVFQDTSTSLNPLMKVEDIICEPLLNFNLIKKEDKRKVASEFLEKVELDNSFLNKKAGEMSGGQRQRVSLARALILNPKILILDEPTSALDVITQHKILSLIKKLQQENNLSILFICHDLALVSSFSDRIAVMRQGEIVETIQLNTGIKKDLSPYTQKLLSSIFDIKKCSCKVDQKCSCKVHYDN